MAKPLRLLVLWAQFGQSAWCLKLQQRQNLFWGGYILYVGEDLRMITASGQFFNSFRLHDKPFVEEKREACGGDHTSSTEWRKLRSM